MTDNTLTLVMDKELLEYLLNLGDRHYTDDVVQVLQEAEEELRQKIEPLKEELSALEERKRFIWTLQELVKS